MNEIIYSLPILILSLTAILSIVIDALKKDGIKYTKTFIYVGLLASFCASVYLLNLDLKIDTSGFKFINNQLIFTKYAYFFDALFCLAGLGTAIISGDSLRRRNWEKDEFYSLIAFSIAGMSIIAHSNNFLSVFIGIETISVCFYVMAGYFRKNQSSVESALKYFILGAFSTAFFVFGVSLIYGALGTMYFNEFAQAINNFGDKPFNKTLFSAGVGLLIVGLGFKIAAFPFHQWAIDVYSGAPTVVAGFLSSAGKAAVVSAFITILIPLYGAINFEKAKIAIGVISALTMLYGNIAALRQTSVKRMLAYSSIAHAGYMLIAFSAGNSRGFLGVSYYAFAYLFMQLGALAIVSILEKDSEDMTIDDFKGLSKNNPAIAFAMTIFMFSLAGIPPFSGFFAKYTIFISAIETGWLPLAIIGIVSSIIAAYFYIALIMKMYFVEPNEAHVYEKKIGFIFVLVSTIITIAIGLFPDLILKIVA